MTRRRVTNVRRDNVGNIIGLCNLNPKSQKEEDDWYSVSSKDAIEQIREGIFSYFVRISDIETEIHISFRNGTWFLQTDPDRTWLNNLEALPEC